MRILFTAFKGKHNTSFQFVNELGGEAVFLTNSFQGLQKDISSINCGYDTVYMFGVDKSLTDTIRIDTCAQYNGEWIATSFDTVSLADRLKDCQISYTVSNKPTRYLCNAAYYYFLKKNPNTVFIHLPSAKGMNAALMNTLIAFWRKNWVENT